MRLRLALAALATLLLLPSGVAAQGQAPETPKVEDRSCHHLVLEDPLVPCPEDEDSSPHREQGSDVRFLVSVALALVGLHREPRRPEVAAPRTDYAVPAMGAPGREDWLRTVGDLNVVRYEVQEDEALLKIADRFGVTRRKILRANQGMIDMAPFVNPGDIILVPVSLDISDDVITTLPGVIEVLILPSRGVEADPAPSEAESPTPS